jgi:uncharacterized protein (TIGR03083 family)
MASISSLDTVRVAESIPSVTADEAYSLMRTALERFMALIETLEPQDWGRPTACTLWTVREIVAHQAGGYASGTGYREMFRQYARIPRRGQLPEDAINALQVGERAGRTPAELIQELRQDGPVAIRKWAYQFRVVKPIAASHPVGGWASLRYLMWVIHSRDTWMHRLDICRATGRRFEQTAEHDGRIMALIVQDAEKALRKKLGGKAVVLDLTGIAGGVWKLGAGKPAAGVSAADVPAASVRMDALDFAIFASGRFTKEEARARAAVSGDVEVADVVFENLLILF